MAKSWDIQPNRAPARPATPAPQRAAPAAPRRFDDIRPIAPVGKKKRAKKSQPIFMPMPLPSRHEVSPRVTRAPRIPLGRKRKLRRTRLLTFLGVGLLVIFIAGIVVLWQPWFRVSDVHAEGPSASAMQAFAQSELSGTRFFVVPKNSIFFLPAAELRTKILAEFPEAEAVSLHPLGFQTLSIIATPRAAVAWWCGASLTETVGCYHLDAQGLVFSPITPDETAASTSVLSLYAPLAPRQGTTSPAGATLANKDMLPKLLEFVKAIRSLNANVVSVLIRGDEADLYTPAGTRITYVLGHESTAAALVASAFPDLNLNDGSLLYVDLRFDNKVYFKKRNSK